MVHRKGHTGSTKRYPKKSRTHKTSKRSPRRSPRRSRTRKTSKKSSEGSFKIKTIPNPKSETFFEFMSRVRSDHAAEVKNLPVPVVAKAAGKIWKKYK